MQVRRLNESGLNKLGDFLEEARQANSPVELPSDLIDSPLTSGGLNTAAIVEPQPQIQTKLEMAKYLRIVLGGVDQSALLGDRGVWAWLGLFFFDNLCPVRSNGQRRVLRDEYYVLQTDYKKYYHHLLRTPYFLYQSFEERAGKALLTGAVFEAGDMIEQIASRQEYITCHPVLEVLDRLYYEEADGVGRVRRGATSRNRDGSVRSLVRFLQQIDATYDLYGMNGENILELLPPEFDDWK